MTCNMKMHLIQFVSMMMAIQMKSMKVTCKIKSKSGDEFRFRKTKIVVPVHRGHQRFLGSHR